MSDSDVFVEFCKNVAKLKTVNADVFSENKVYFKLEFAV